MADERVRLKLNVRTLAELTCRSGDIHYRYDDSTQGREGIAAQQRAQRGRPDTYVREASVNGTWENADVELELAGRADGWDPVAGVVEEFKTTRTEPMRLFEHAGSVHMGQLKLYAALLAREHSERSDWRLRLLYCDPDSDAIRPFETRVERNELLDFLDRCCERIARRLAALRAHRQRRDARLGELAFPFPAFRSAQRALSAEVFRTVRDGGALLLEAPTGSGKTIGALFPALLAMGRGMTDRVVFLTSKTTGQSAAEATVRTLGVHDVLRQVTVTAKAKICFMPEPVCDPTLCRYARGYYDRIDGAVDELLSRATMTRATVEAVAKVHDVCPFELSLDAAVWADVVVCDYNYVFDPVVRLKRLAGVSGDSIALLIDEAHQLADRVRDALSTVLSRALLRAARPALVGDAIRRAATLDRRFTALRRDSVVRLGLERAAFECRIEAPTPLFEAAQLLLEAIATSADAAPPVPAVTELTFALARLGRVVGWFDHDRFGVFLRGRGRDIEIDVRCLDASAAIAETLSEYRAHVRFSATLAPFDATERSHGGPKARTRRLPSPFPPDRLGVFVVPDVSTLFRQRHASLPALLRVIETLVAARPGNYLVALPSFDYLEIVADAYAACHPAQQIVRQVRGMSDVERLGFIAAFSAEQPIVAFAVLGGVFTESIDLPEGALSGIAVVGIGLPPPTLERDAMVQLYGQPFGRVLSYEQPAMTRVVQAAGRLIRRATDRGVVCLIDGRYVTPLYRDYLPPHWQPARTPSRALASALAEFWQRGSG